MEVLEIPAMIAALVLMLAAVGAKIVTLQLIGHMKSQISQVTHLKQEALNRLKTVQSQKSVIERNQQTLMSKKNKLAKRISRLKREMQEFKDKEKVRQQRSAIRKVELDS